MADQSTPASKSQAQDPSYNYERSHPDRESPQGSLAKPTPAPAKAEDHVDQAVGNRQPGDLQLNGDDSGDGLTHAQERGKQLTDLPVPGSVARDQPDHSMNDEEPEGWDLAPTEATPPEQSRHPRTGGKGGTPDVGEPMRNG
jgi:hypothetical protein